MPSLLDILRLRVAEDPHRPLLFLPTGEVSYFAFFRQAWAVGQAVAQTTQPGDRVGLSSENPLVLWAGMFGCWMHGRVGVLLPKTLSALDQKALSERAKVKFLLDDEVFAYSARPAFSGTSSDVLEEDDWHAVLCTSGSSGEPKAVCLSLSALTQNATRAAQALKLSAKDRILVTTPPYYTSSLMHFLSALSAGGSFVYRRGFFYGEKLLKEMAELRCTGFGGAPTHLKRVIDEKKLALLPKTVRFWVCSGDSLAPKTAAAALKAESLEVFVMYGLTEVAGRLCFHLVSSEKISSVGRPLPGMKLTIRDEKGREVSVGTVGECFVSGDMLMLGYLGKDGEIQKLPEFGFATGDFGYEDSEGFLYLEGRRDEVIKSGAEKVSLRRVREVLLAQKEVKDALVLAVSDPQLGLVPAAFVVTQGPEETARALRKVREQLPASHYPKRVKTLEALPVLGSGKWDRLGLRQTAWFDDESEAVHA